jgi:pimeloyl-ACP methyl ester carboxylesterase
LVFFEKSGHMPFYEEPSKFVEVVARFLAAH